MNDAAGRASDFQMNGFTVVQQLLSTDEVEAARRQLDQFISSRLSDLPDTDVIRAQSHPYEIVILAKLDRHEPFFARLKQDHRLRRLARELLNAECQPLHVDFINKHRQAKATRPHQDAYIFTRLPSESLTCWLALDRVDADNGCLVYVRGSHWQGYRGHDTRSETNQLLDYGAEDKAHEVQVLVEPGDLVVHHSFTVHRSESNRTGRPRRALAIPFIRSESEVMAKDEWIALHETRGLLPR